MGGGTNQWYLAVDRTNGQHWRKVVWAISRQGSAGDYYVAAVDRPWPEHIGTLPIAFYSGQGTNSFTNKLTASVELRHHWPTFYNSQYLRTEGANFYCLHRMPDTWTRQHPTESPTNVLFAGGTDIPLRVNATSIASNSLGAVMGGDSGSPTYMVISNKLVLFSGSWRTASLITDLNQFLADVNKSTISAGFTTNQYPVQFEWLTAFPARQ